MTGATDSLRLDLFLKRSRLVKRRPLAALLCREGHVMVNGSESGPGKGVKRGDRLRVRLMREMIEVEVLSLPGRGAGGEGSFRVIGREKTEEEPL